MKKRNIKDAFNPKIFIPKRKEKVIFMGTPSIATSALKALINKGYQVVAIITQPDKPVGRKKVIEYSPVKKIALEQNIKLFQPNKIIEIYDELKEIDFDLFVTCAYGQFIPNKILDLAKYGCINAHASLLPKYRGGAPIHWAIINGEQKTGVTLMKTIKEMDAGDMFISYSLNIEENDNLKTLFKKMEKVIYLIIYYELENILNGKLKPIKQDEKLATKGLNITKEQEIISFNDKAINVVNWVKGLYENPCATVIYNNIKIKLYEVVKTDIISTLQPNTIVDITKNGIQVATKDFDVLIKEFKIEGKNRIHIKDFYMGNRLFENNKKFN